MKTTAILSPASMVSAARQYRQRNQSLDDSTAHRLSYPRVAIPDCAVSRVRARERTASR